MTSPVIVPRPDERATRSVRASVWRLPSPSLRFVPVFRRNLLVWRKLAAASLIGNILDPLITLVAFGYGLGRMIGAVDGVPYIVYLFAGSILWSSAMAATFEGMYSAYSRMAVQRTWESLLNAPLELDDIVIAEWLWCAAKGVLSGVAIIGVGLALGLSREWTLLLLPVVIVLTGLTFSAMALIVNAIARGYDFFTYYFTLVVSPMVFLSGVYYPVDGLPDALAAVARLLPLSVAVELARPLVFGRWPEHAPVLAAILLTYGLGGLYVALVLTRRRFTR